MPTQDHREDDIFFPFAGREGLWRRKLPNVYENKLNRLARRRAENGAWEAIPPRTKPKDPALFGAEDFMRRAAGGNIRTMGWGHPTTLRSLAELGQMQLDQGRPGEAERWLRFALKGLESDFGPFHPTTIQTLRKLADSLEAQVMLIDNPRSRLLTEQGTDDQEKTMNGSLAKEDDDCSENNGDTNKNSQIIDESVKYNGEGYQSSGALTVPPEQIHGDARKMRPLTVTMPQYAPAVSHVDETTEMKQEMEEERRWALVSDCRALRRRAVDACTDLFGELHATTLSALTDYGRAFTLGNSADDKIKASEIADIHATFVERAKRSLPPPRAQYVPPTEGMGPGGRGQPPIPDFPDVDIPDFKGGQPGIFS